MQLRLRHGPFGVLATVAILPLLLGVRECESDPTPPVPPPSTDCFVSGCSGTVCTDDPDGVATTCEWRDEYACYRSAACERQADGACGWTDTPELRLCLDDGGPPDPPPADCGVGGCSGTICTDSPEDVVTTCEWREEYACYLDATCERQADGACGWTATPELSMCLTGVEPPPTPSCYVAGCSGTLCTDDPEGPATTCEWREEYACYRDATCERQADGACGWTATPELVECLDDGGPPPVAPCFIGGCSSQLCSDAPGAISTCEWREEYACYRTAACERQADGVCAWTPTPELDMCLAGAS
jgi:eight-cysteine-cluster-containing protein